MGKDIFDLSDVLDGENPVEQSEEIEIAYYQGVAGTPPTLTLASGVWSDLDRIEFNGGYTDSGFISGHEVLTKKDILDHPTDWQLILRNGNPDLDLFVSIQATSSNTASLTYGLASGIKSVVGYRKRTVTETKQVIIPVTPDWVSSGSFVNTDEVVVQQRYTIGASKLPSDFRNTDGTIKSSVKAKVQLYVAGAAYTGWAEHSKDIFDSSVNVHVETGAEVDVLDTAIAVRTAGNATTGARSDGLVRTYLSNPWGITANVTSAPCQVIVWNDEKTAISVPVGDKGYGGLVKTTLATAIADFTVPTVIDFDTVAVTTPLKVVQNVVDSRLSLNQIGMWETTGNLELGFDTANGDRKIKIELWNETSGGLAAETTRYVARNQSGDSIPFTIGLVEVLNTGHEYSLRIYSADSFSNVVVNKCRWDVKLYTAL